MICDKCGNKKIALFTSVVCDFCEGKQITRFVWVAMTNREKDQIFSNKVLTVYTEWLQENERAAREKIDCETHWLFICHLEHNGVYATPDMLPSCMILDDGTTSDPLIPIFANREQAKSLHQSADEDVEFTFDYSSHFYAIIDVIVAV